MSLRALETLRKATGFRLALMVSAFFVVGTLLLFGFAYLLLADSLTARDHDAIDMRLRQLAAQFQTVGLAGLEKSLALERRLGQTKPYFVRLAGPGNALLFMEIPDQWADFDLTRLERLPTTAPGSYIRLLAKDDPAVLEIASMRLPDGSVLQVGKSTEDRDEVLSLFVRNLAAITIAMAGFGVLGGALLAMRALHPIHELISTVRAIDSGTMAARVPVRQTGDELDELAVLFNAMLDRIAKLIESMRDALDNVAHELRTPIARIRGMAEVALQVEQEPRAAQEALADCIEESDNLLRLLDGLMDISEAEAGTLKLALEPVNVAMLIEDAVDLYRYVAEEKGVSIIVKTPQGIWVTGDRSRLRQVVANLLDNAIKYTPNGGLIQVEGHRDISEVVISFSDTGMGIGAEELTKIWERLYRGDHTRSQRGMGLGLSLVKAIVEAHRGRVEASSAAAQGSTFRVVLPSAPAPNECSLPPGPALLSPN